MFYVVMMLLLILIVLVFISLGVNDLTKKFDNLEKRGTVNSRHGCSRDTASTGNPQNEAETEIDS